MRLTSSQALLRFLAAQVVERDGVQRRFFGGCFGIFGHGNVAGLGQALYERQDLLRFIPARNEPDLDDVPAEVLEALTVKPMTDVAEIIAQALRLLGKSFFEGPDLLKSTTTLHDTTLGAYGS